MLTEAEMRTKWCPEARMGLNNGSAVNRTAVMSEDGEGYANVYAETRCIGSDCAMWQWYRIMTYDADNLCNGTEPSKTHGYCGKAGKPW